MVDGSRHAKFKRVSAVKFDARIVSSCPMFRFTISFLFFQSSFIRRGASIYFF